MQIADDTFQQLLSVVDSAGSRLVALGNYRHGKPSERQDLIVGVAVQAVHDLEDARKAIGAILMLHQSKE